MRHSYFWTLVVVIFTVELYSILPLRKQEPEPGDSPVRQDIVQGVIHVHSTFSDGGGSPKEIVNFANQAGLDFVVLTDHNTYEAKKQGFEGAYGKTDLYVEMESSTPVGHAISFFSESESLKQASSETIVQATYDQFLKKAVYPGLFSAVAHPSNIKNPWGRLDDFVEGLEVVNFDSSWQRQLSETPIQFLITLLVYPFNSYLSSIRFLDIYPKDFSTWDQMTSRGPGHFVYLAHDTHAKVKLNNKRSLAWPGYLQTFKLASNVLFLDEPKASDFLSRKKQVYKSLRRGRSAIHYQSLFPFLSNRWQVKCGKKEYSSGDIVGPVGECQSIVTTPATPFTKWVRLIKNGDVTHEILVPHSTTESVILPMSGAGTYRVEIWAKVHTALRLTLNRLSPYVFYSPIYLQ